MAEVEVPAFSAYVTSSKGDRIHRQDDGTVDRWTENTQLTWYGFLKQPGELALSLKASGEISKRARLQLEVASQEDPESVSTLRATLEGDRAEFGTATIPKPGYYRFSLEGKGRELPSLKALILSGEASEEAHFSKVERQNATSVHLGYPVPEEAAREVEWFYLEVTPKTEPLWSYYEATGWHRGYFGLQVNSPTERRIIFSVWDAGNEAIDRGKVAEDDRVKLLGKGPKVNAGDFGNEGTGGHSHLVYPWKLGDTVHFLMQAQPEGDHTTYTGWFRDSKEKDWRLVSSFRAPRDGKFLSGLYSFNENFSGRNGQERRICEFGNGWVRSRSGKWFPLTQAVFTHDGHGAKERLDRSAGVVGKRFYLANGGFVEDPNPNAVTKAHDKLAIAEPEGTHPTERELEQLPRP